MCTHVCVTVIIKGKEAMNLGESERSVSRVGRKGGRKLQNHILILKTCMKV